MTSLAMRILLVTPFVPHRAVGHGTANVAAHFFGYFAARHDVTVLSFAFDQREQELAAEVGARGAEAVAIPFPDGHLRRWARRGAAILAGEPFVIRQFDVPAMRRALSWQMTRRPPFDLVQFDTTFMGNYVDEIDRAPRRPRAALVETDVSTTPLARRLARERAPAKRLWYRRELNRMERYEPALCRRFDRVFAVSPEDRRELQRLDPTLDVRLFRYGAELPMVESVPRCGRGQSLLFVGAFLHEPNVEAAAWLCRHVLPRVRARRPDASCWLVGGNPPGWLERLGAAQGATTTGFVPDLDGFLARADVGVVPLQSGGGVKLKTLAMMAAGRAVVTTRIGIEGVSARDGEHVLVADTAEEFANAVLGLLDDGELRARLGRNARALIARDHQWPENLRRLESEYLDLVGRTEAPDAAAM